MSEPLNTVVVRHSTPGDYGQYDAGDLDLPRNTLVIVDTEFGPQTATILMPPEQATGDKKLRKVLRVANDDDRRTFAKNADLESEADALCRERIATLKLEMKLIKVVFAHNGRRAIFYFTSPHRVDFRALVKDLARRFHTRIEMRQIGVRDAARHTGGLGSCGREVCCSTWLPEFQPISIRMAKDQNLALNHNSLSGVCGRLRCCLHYEQSTYQQARKSLPAPGKRVTTPDGVGVVREVNVLRLRIAVQLATGELKHFDAANVALIVNREKALAPPREVVDKETTPMSKNRKRRRRRKRGKQKPADGDSQNSGGEQQ